jgi:hypothetical protein
MLLFYYYDCYYYYSTKPKLVLRCLRLRVNQEEDIFLIPIAEATAQDSVQTEFNLHPPDPRCYSLTDDMLQADVDNFRMRTNAFYERCKGTNLMTTKDIKSSLNRSISYVCDAIPTSGTVKRTLVTRMSVFAVSFISTIHRRLVATEENLVQTHLSCVTLPEFLDGVVSVVNGPVNKALFMQFDPNSVILLDLMGVMLNLLTKRDQRLRRAYDDKHRRTVDYTPRQPCCFYNSNFIHSLEQGVDVLPIWAGAHRIYMTVKLDGANGDDWALLFLDVDSKSVYYIDPRKTRHDPADQETTNRLLRFQILINRVLPTTGLDASVLWRCEMYPHVFFDPLSNNVDSGIYVFIILYFLCVPCPLAFAADDIPKLRKTLAYYVLAGDLPF